MPIEMNGIKYVCYEGDYHPAKLMYGDKVLYEPDDLILSGVEGATIPHTYNHTADVTVKGKTELLSDWYNKTGLYSLSDYTNLMNTAWRQGQITSNGDYISVVTTCVTTTDIIPINYSNTYTFKFVSSATISGIEIVLCSGANVYSITSFPGNIRQVTFNANGQLWITGIRVNIISPTILYPENISNWQLNAGSTALPYEPYVYVSPTTGYPKKIVSNLPAGTYKVQDANADWYEFTLDKDLGGISEVADSVEFDKISHKGYLRKKINKVDLGSLSWGGYTTWNIFYAIVPNIYNPDSYTPVIYADRLKGILCTNYKVSATVAYNETMTDMSMLRSDGRIRIKDTSYTDTTVFKASVSGAYLHYQLATPTRMPLTFTKNNASTAPECPMEFLTNTASVDYPAQLYSASGSITSRGKNQFDISKVVNTLLITNNGDYLQLITNNGDYLQVTASATSTASGVGNPGTLKDLAPSLRVGETYTLSAVSTGTTKALYLNIAVVTWVFGQAMTITQAMLDSRVYFYASGKSTTAHVSQIQIEKGTSISPYEPYVDPVTVSFPKLSKVGLVADTFETKTGKLIPRCGTYESYNGETITTPYISSTGGLDTGAKVVYQLPEPAEPVILTPAPLATYHPTTVIETDCEGVLPTMDITVKIEK